jgi:hypothetical protein
MQRGRGRELQYSVPCIDTLGPIQKVDGQSADTSNCVCTWGGQLESLGTLICVLTERDR